MPWLYPAAPIVRCRSSIAPLFCRRGLALQWRVCDTTNLHATSEEEERSDAVEPEHADSKDKEGGNESTSRSLLPREQIKPPRRFEN